VTIVPTDIVRHARDMWPDDVPFATSIQSASESQRTTWLAAGRADGFVTGDTLLAEHAGWPVARLELARVEEHVSLASVTPLVANRTVSAGDAAHLWPTPHQRRSGRIRSRVMRIVPRGTDFDIWIPAASPETARVDDRWIIQRHGEYV